MRRILAGGGHTKRSAVRLAIVEAIRKGILAPGDYLPSEVSLSRSLDVSLGTVQAALEQLKQFGTIVRRRGDGTRIASAEPFGRDIWHFRFVDKQNGQPLRTMKEAVEIDHVPAGGPAKSFLGDDDSYIRIRRHLIMSGDVPVGADMFLRAQTVSGLDSVNPNELLLINVRPYLAERFGIAPVGASHLVKTTVLDSVTATTFRFRPQTTVFDIHARASAADTSPVYFQRILVAVADCDLSF